MRTIEELHAIEDMKRALKILDKGGSAATMVAWASIIRTKAQQIIDNHLGEA